MDNKLLPPVRIKDAEETISQWIRMLGKHYKGPVFAGKGHLNASITYQHSGGTFHPTLQHSNCRCLPMFMMMAGLPSSLDVFVILCRLGGQAPIFQGMFFPNSQIRSGSRGQWLCVSWHSEGCYSGYWWSCAAVHYLYPTWNKMKLRFSRYHKRKSQSGMNSGYYDHFKKQLF